MPTDVLMSTSAGGWLASGSPGVVNYRAASTTPVATFGLYDDDNTTWPNQTATPAPPSPWIFDGWYYDLTQLTVIYAILIILSVVVMFVGLIGNSMVIAVVCRHRAMRTPTNFYIVSLALSDFLVTSFVMPLKLLELTADTEVTILNAVLCSVLGFLQPYFVFTSIWTLVAISIDRYLVILHPLRSRSFNTRSRAGRNVAAIWIMPFLVLAGYFYPHVTMMYRMTSDLGVIRRTTCRSKLPHFIQQWYALLQFTVLLLVPVALLCFTCFSIARRLFRLTEDEKMLKTSLRKEEASRRKVAKMVLVVVFAFVMCWAPFFIVTLVNHFAKFMTHRNFFFWQCVLFLLGFSNSCMNPIIYAFMSRAFRRGFRGIIVCFCPCTKPCFKNKSKFGNTRRSVTIISSEPGNDACRVGNDGDKGHKKRRAAGKLDRHSRWNNTQYSTVSETETIDMTRLATSTSSSNGGLPERHTPKSKTDSFMINSPPQTDSKHHSETKDKNCNHKTAPELGNPRSFTINENDDDVSPSSFEDVSLYGEPPHNHPSTDHNWNTTQHPVRMEHPAVIPETDEEPECTAPLLVNTETKP